MRTLIRVSRIAVIVVGTIAAASLGVSGQLLYSSGQNVVPVFEGWERNTDGTFNMLFGYFNRNRDEIVDVPIGPDNKIEPGPGDRGQPTHFFPSRNRYWFRVPVAADFGSKELVWTLTAHGKTERAYATLNPNYAIDRSVEQLDTAGINLWWAEEGVNKPPTVRMDGESRRQVKVGEPLPLAAIVADDGVPPAPKVAERRGRYAWYGLRVAWFIDRGAGRVTFAPVQFKVYPDSAGNSPWTPGWTAPPVPPDHKYPVTVTFQDQGAYVVRVMAHDGGLATTADVQVSVQ
jgi:hypothetical protein